MTADVVTMPQPVATDEPVVRVYRLDWTGDNLPHPLDVQFQGETVYYAHRHADQVWAQVQEWLTERPGSDVVVSMDEIPLDEWIGDYGGDPEDVQS